MYFHLFVALVSWIIGFSIPSLSDPYLAAIMILGFIAFLLFLKETYIHLNHQLLLQADEAEKINYRSLSSFKGSFVMIRDDNSPFSDDFSYIIFNNGEFEIPLYCRNHLVIEKAMQANKELIVYYKDYILVNVEEAES